MEQQSATDILRDILDEDRLSENVRAHVQDILKRLITGEADNPLSEITALQDKTVNTIRLAKQADHSDIANMLQEVNRSLVCVIIMIYPSRSRSS